jgi:glycosyltransferase involved in cell wall biosynthesis
VSVLHIIAGLGIGGAERALLQIAGGLNARGIPQHVVSLGRGNELRADFESKGVNVNVLNPSIWSAPCAIWRIVQIVRSERPRVIQGWMYHGDIAAALAHRLVPGKTERRLFWGLRASNMDLERYGWLIRAEARLSAWPDAIIANSKRGIQTHLSFGYRPRRAEVIPNGIDTARFSPNPQMRLAVRSELGIPQDAFVAILVARIDRMKDHPTFLQAMQANPKIIGLLVGKGTDTLRGPANIRAIGIRHDVERLYAAADVVVSSSAFGEGFPNVVAEGMSSGLVPIVTGVGDSAIIVGETGRVVPPGDAEALATAIAAEARMSSVEHASRGAAARRRIFDYYTVDSAVSAFERLYRSV